MDEDIVNKIRSINKSNKDKAIDFAYTNRLGAISEFTILNDKNIMLQVKPGVNSSGNTEDNMVGVLSTKEHKIAVQEILFEKYWNEVQSLSGITAP